MRGAVVDFRRLPYRGIMVGSNPSFAPNWANDWRRYHLKCHSLAGRRSAQFRLVWSRAKGDATPVWGQRGKVRTSIENAPIDDGRGSEDHGCGGWFDRPWCPNVAEPETTSPICVCRPSIRL